MQSVKDLIDNFILNFANINFIVKYFIDAATIKISSTSCKITTF